jgi:aspartate aminotransferase
VSTPLSERVQRIKPSPTLAVTAKANELKAAGKDVIGLGAGEPDFDTPDFIKQAAIKAINAGFTKYTPVDGTASLKKAIIAKFQRDNGLSYEPKQILVSCGGKQSFYNLAQALLNSGDEVIIPAPYWVSYPDMVLLADGKPVIVEAGIDQHFKITAKQLEAAITPRTKLLVINSPSNPTGVAYSAAELAALGEVLRRHPQVYIATDDMYEHIQWTGEKFSQHPQSLPGSLRPHHCAEWRLQGVFDDRLADWLLRRAQGFDQRHDQHPVAEHLQPDFDFAGRGGSGAERRSILHRDDDQGVQGAA